MPCDYSKYPRNWHEISKRVRADAGNRCQRCFVENGAVIFRSVDGKSWYDAAQDCSFEYPSGERLPDYFEADMRDKATRVVLTVAHVGENRHDKHNCENLEALCQACHLAEDMQDHIANRRASAMARRAVGSLFEVALP